MDELGGARRPRWRRLVDRPPHSRRDGRHGRRGRDGPTSRSDGGRSTAVEADLSGPAAGGRGGRRDRDAGAPRRGRRPHPHAGRDGRGARPVLPGLGRGRVRRHDDVPRVQQPRHGLVAGGRAIAPGRAARVARRDGRRLRGRLRARRSRSAGTWTTRSPSCRRWSTRASRRRRRSWSSTSGSTTGALRGDAGPGRARRDAPGPLRGPGAHRCRRRRRARARRHAAAVPRLDPRPPRPRRSRRPRHGVRPRGRRAGPRRPPVLRGGARPRARAKAAASGRTRRRARTTSPSPTRGTTTRLGSVRVLRHLAAAAPRCGPGRAVGGPRRRLARPGRHRPRPRPDGRREGRGRAAASRSTRSATARRGSRRCWRSPTPRASPRAGSRSSAWSTCSRRRRRACSGSSARARSRSAGMPTSCCSTRGARRTLRAADLHHTSDYTPYEGLAVTGAVRDVFVRGPRSSDGRVRRTTRVRAVRRAGRDRRLARHVLRPPAAGPRQLAEPEVEEEAKARVLVALRVGDHPVDAPQAPAIAPPGRAASARYPGRDVPRRPRSCRCPPRSEPRGDPLRRRRSRPR